MRPSIVGILLVFVTLAFVGCDEDEKKPSWWPKNGKSRFKAGIDWPPPKPGGWPQDEEWPPPAEVGEDPEFWTELYGEDLDSDEDERLEESGSLGKMSFRYNFEVVESWEPEKRPGCGLFTFHLASYARAETCEPYPEEKVRAHCKIASDEQLALQTCRTICMRNKQRCRIGRLFEPAFHVAWGCRTSFLPGPDFETFTTIFQTECFADYLCDCYEN